MPTEAINIAALEALLTREPAEAGDNGSREPQAEHPLARDLRLVLANPSAHRVGDLARVVDSILKEMAMFKAAHGVTDEPGN